MRLFLFYGWARGREGEVEKEEGEGEEMWVEEKWGLRSPTPHGRTESCTLRILRMLLLVLTGRRWVKGRRRREGGGVSGVFSLAKTKQAHYGASVFVLWSGEGKGGGGLMFNVGVF